jgi:hypothetical protein
MSQGFNLRFDKMRENNPAGNQDSSTQNPDRYDTPGYTRNVCFVWPDGKRVFFNYAYLVVAEFNPNEDMNEIRLEFSSHIVLLKGYRLDGLFVEFLDHVPRLVEALDRRYALNVKDCTVINIQVKDKG